jgi:hypothetical protein
MATAYYGLLYASPPHVVKMLNIFRVSCVVRESSRVFWFPFGCCICCCLLSVVNRLTGLNG